MRNFTLKLKNVYYKIGEREIYVLNAKRER
jgi:hypothetical protein